MTTVNNYISNDLPQSEKELLRIIRDQAKTIQQLTTRLLDDIVVPKFEFQLNNIKVTPLAMDIITGKESETKPKSKRAKPKSKKGTKR